MLTRDQEDAEEVVTTFRIELQEQLLFESNVSVQFRGKLEARLVASVAGVPIGASGQLRASLLMDGRVLGPSIV